jgi:hypothetical protein
MASTSTPADPRFDGGVLPTEVNDQFSDLEEALAKLIHANYAPEARARASAPDMSAGARIPPSFEATLGFADRRGADRARDQVSLRKRGVLAGVTIAVCVGASAIWAWRSYGGPAPGLAAVPPAIDTAGGDLAALRQTIARLAAGQDQLTRELAKLQAEKPQADKPSTEKPGERMLRRVSAPAAPPLAAPARKPAAKTPMSPQTARRLSPSIPSPPSRPVPQIASQPQLSALRPPMPVPHP